MISKYLLASSKKNFSNAFCFVSAFILTKTLAMSTSTNSNYKLILKSPTPNQAFGVETETSLQSIFIDYEVSKNDQTNFEKDLDICVWLDDQAGVRNGPFCIPFTSKEGNVTLQNLGIGSYKLSSAVAKKVENEEDKHITKSPTVIVDISVVEKKPFIASYEWQNVYDWQSVPTGLEIVMPLDDKMKKARIPNPWRIQTYIQAKRNFFFREDVYRRTTIEQLQNQIASHQYVQTRTPCVHIMFKGKRLNGSETIESINLFSHQKEFEVIIKNDESCFYNETKQTKNNFQVKKDFR